MLQINLRSEGYAPEIVPVAADINPEDIASATLIIVDAMKQDFNGIDLIDKIKRDPASADIPVIFLSTYRSERMAILALDTGADDCMRKPFSLRELLARIKSLLRRNARRPSQSSRNVLTFKGLEVNLTTRTARLDGEPLSLIKTEFAILEILLKSVDTYVSRVMIHKGVWSGDTAGSNERIVDTNISRLRKKIGDVGACIVNQSGLGYMISSRNQTD